MAKYTFKYWFEWGCSENFCPCLWSNDDFTKDKFGYDVKLSELPISQDLVQFLCELGIEHDKALDWELSARSVTLDKRRGGTVLY